MYICIAQIESGQIGFSVTYACILEYAFLCVDDEYVYIYLFVCLCYVCMCMFARADLCITCLPELQIVMQVGQIFSLLIFFLNINFFASLLHLKYQT